MVVVSFPDHFSPHGKNRSGERPIPLLFPPPECWQIFPELKAPSYINSDGSFVGRTEVERRIDYIQQIHQQLGHQHPIILMIERCLHNNPRHRPTVNHILQLLDEATAQVPDRYGQMSRLEVEQVLEERKEEIVQLQQEVGSFRLEVGSLQQQLEHQQMHVESKELQLLSEILSQKQKLQSKDRELQSKDQNLQSKDQDLQSKCRELQSKDQELQSKNHQLDQKNWELELNNRKLQYKDQQLQSQLVEIRNLRVSTSEVYIN